jgi:hypothetical protein
MICRNCQSRQAQEGLPLCEQCHLRDLESDKRRLTPADLSDLSQRLRSDLVEERIFSHWLNPGPDHSVDDETVVLNACLSGLYAPIELGLPWSAFSGVRCYIWRAVCTHYERESTAPDLDKLSTYIGETLRCSGPIREELGVIRDDVPFQAEEWVLAAARRLLDAARAREWVEKVSRVALQVRMGAVDLRTGKELVCNF